MKHIIEGALEDVGFVWLKNLDVWRKVESERYWATVVEAKIDHLDGLQVYCTQISLWAAGVVSDLSSRITIRLVETDMEK